MSIFEISLVLLLLSVLSLSVLQGYRGTLHHHRLSEARNKVNMAIRFARMQAITKAKHTRLNFQVKGRNAHTWFVAEASGRQKTYKTIVFNQQVNITWRLFPAVNYIEFNSLGEAMQKGHFTFCYKQTEECLAEKLVINRSGYVHLA